MKNKNIINKHSKIFNEFFPYRKNNFKTEKDFNENFPKINSKYSSPQYNINDSKLSSKNNLLTERSNKNEINKGHKRKKFSINIKNLAIEDNKDKEEINYNTTNYSSNFQTLNDIIINNILKKKKKKIWNNSLKEKDSDMISTTRNLEKKILEDNKIRNIEMNINNMNNTEKKLEYNNFKNVGINTKLSKTISNFHQSKKINDNNNKMIYSYKTKEKNKNTLRTNNKYKFIFSRNDRDMNNIRTIISSNENKNIVYKMNNNINNINNIKNIVTNNFVNKKVNKIKILSNDITRRVELSDQMNNKISDEYVQNLLSKEIEEIKNSKMKKYEINKNKDLNKDELFQNIKIKNHLNSTENNFYHMNYNNIDSSSKKKNNYIREEILKKKLQYIDQKIILSKLKQFDLHTELQMFDDNYIKKHDELAKLYSEHRKELLNDKEVLMELGHYLFSLPLNNQNKKTKQVKYKDQIIMTDFNNERDKYVYSEEEKNIVKDIIYQLSDDLNENLESYKNINKNNDNDENSINHVIKSISLAQLFERLNKANTSKGKKRRYNNFINNKIENNNTYNNDYQINSNFFKENNKDEENNEENKKILNDILFNIVKKNNMNKDNNNNILNNLLDNLKKGEGNINLISDELKQVLSNNINKPRTENEHENNINDLNNKYNKDIININKKENSKNSPKSKESKKQKRNKNKKHKTIKKQAKDNLGEKNTDMINSNNINKERQLNNDNNYENDLLIKKEDISDNSLEEIKNDIDLIDKQNEKVNNINNDKKIKNNNKKSILSLKNQNKQNHGNNYLIPIKSEKSTKNVRFSVPKDSTIFNSNYKKKESNNISFSSEHDKGNKINNSFFENESNNNKKKAKSNYKKSNKNVNNNQILFDNLKNESFIEDNDFKEMKIERKYSIKTTVVEKKPHRISLMESFSKIKKKKFQKTKRDKSKNKNLISLKNEESNKKINEEIIVDLREEMLNRRLKNFFGKIQLLKNIDANNYDEQLKMFIDNEIDKLNDWETKEQEMRINNFFSDLKLFRKKIAFGDDIKFANPIKFSSTWTNFPKFK